MRLRLLPVLLVIFLEEQVANFVTVILIQFYLHY